MNRKQFQLITIIYSLTLTFGTGYSLLDSFVLGGIGQSGVNILSSNSESSSSSTILSSNSESSSSSTILSSNSESSSSSLFIRPTFGEFSYIDNNMRLQIDVIRRYETQVYVALLTTTDHRLVKSAFGFDTFGRNLYEKTSVIADRKKAIFAINGDYSGFRDIGFVVRNGLVYRIKPRPSGSDDAILLNDNGIMSTFKEGETDLEVLTSLYPWQVWSFGPVLVNQNIFLVNPSSKVTYELASNPRTAIGQISDDKFMFVVSDGRTSESAGLSLYELASVFVEYGARFAYNLDGGGSSTMWFHNRLINTPTNYDLSIVERSVSDIVYIGYEL